MPCSSGAYWTNGIGAVSERNGRAREREAARRAPERLADAVAPAERVAAVVHLVEDHERATGLGDGLVHLGLHADLRVGDRDAVVVPPERAVGVLEHRIEAEVDPVGGVGPLPLEVLGGGDDDHAVDLAAGEELGGEAQGEGRLACARGRRREEVAGRRREVVLEGLGLPGAQLARRAPGGSLGERRGEVLGGRVAGRSRRGRGCRRRRSPWWGLARRVEGSSRHGRHRRPGRMRRYSLDDTLPRRGPRPASRALVEAAGPGACVGRPDRSPSAGVVTQPGRRCGASLLARVSRRFLPLRAGTPASACRPRTGPGGRPSSSRPRASRRRRPTARRDTSARPGRQLLHAHPDEPDAFVLACPSPRRSTAPPRRCGDRGRSARRGCVERVMVTKSPERSLSTTVRPLRPAARSRTADLVAQAEEFASDHGRIDDVDART